jgi:UDP-glucose 4-epimerase
VKALVTGGAGFIGHHLAAALVERGDTVVVLDDLSTGDPERLRLIADRISFIHGDIRQPGDIEEAVAGCEVVFHQAALPSVARSVRDPVATNDVNVTGTIRVMRAAARAGVRRVVFAGSSSVYGSSPVMPRREDQPPAPVSPYAVSKLAAEQYVHTLGTLDGVETVVLRYFNIYGPSQDPFSEYSAVVPRFVTAALEGTPAVVHGDGRQSRDFTHVANAVSANLLAASAPGASGVTANIGCGRRFSLLDLLAAIGAATGRPLDPVFVEPRAGDVRDSQADISVAAERLGYSVVMPFEAGIEQTVAWFRERVATPGSAASSASDRIVAAPE